jgi:hypothetical protein
VSGVGQIEDLEVQGVALNALGAHSLRVATGPCESLDPRASITTSAASSNGQSAIRCSR